MRIPLKLLTLAVISLLIQACGFSLRTDNLTQLDAVHLSQLGPSEARNNLARLLRTQRIQILDSPTKASPSIDHIEESIHERSVSVDSFGRTTQYRVNVDWRVRYSFYGKTETMLLRSSENYALSEDTLVGAQAERNRIVDLVQRELAIELLQRLSLEKRSKGNEIE